LFEMGVYFSGWFIKQRDDLSDNSAESPAASYKPMSDAEMDAELDRIEKEDKT